jgi:hypothetical protein
MPPSEHGHQPPPARYLPGIPCRARAIFATVPLRIAAQIVDGFADLNDNAERLFATPDKGLNR